MRRQQVAHGALGADVAARRVERCACHPVVDELLTGHTLETGLVARVDPDPKRRCARGGRCGGRRWHETRPPRCGGVDPFAAVGAVGAEIAAGLAVVTRVLGALAAVVAAMVVGELARVRAQ